MASAVLNLNKKRFCLISIPESLWGGGNLSPHWCDPFCGSAEQVRQQWMWPGSKYKCPICFHERSQGLSDKKVPESHESVPL